METIIAIAAIAAGLAGLVRFVRHRRRWQQFCQPGPTSLKRRLDRD